MQLEHIHTNQVFKTRQFPIRLVCDSISSPANVGALFRTADAFGVEKILFFGVIPDLRSPRLQKTSRNTHQNVLWEAPEAISLTDFLKQEQQNNRQVIVLEITTTSVPIQELTEIDIKNSTLVLGNEQQGVRDSIIQLADKVVHIPMYGSNSSMNVSQAASIALFYFTNLIP